MRSRRSAFPPIRPRTDRLRGIGKADASYILERLVDIAARQLKIDPIDIRMKNFIPADAFPYRNVTGALYDSGQYHLAMKRTAEIAGYEQLRKEQVELRKKASIAASAWLW